MPLHPSWDERTLPEGRWFRCSFGPLHLLIFNRGDEWQTVRGDEESFAGLPEEGDHTQLPDHFDWIRWSCEKNDRLVRLRPCFPNLPIIAKPRNSFTIAPSSSALFYIGIPASLEIQASAQGTMLTLATLPTQQLSKTWHGNRSVGNPCFALRTRARRIYEPENWPEHDIVCAVDLKNQRSTSFPFESLYLDTGHLAIFEQDGRLWSNASRVNIQVATAQEAEMTYAPRPMEPAAQARQLVEPILGSTRKSTILSAFSSFSDVLR